MKQYLKLLIAILIPLIASCGNENEAPSLGSKDLIGYWAITHIKKIEHKGNNQNTDDEDIPPHGWDQNASDINYRFDVLIFDENYVTVRGDMPSCPKTADYDMDTIDGQIEYEKDRQEWFNSIGDSSDQLGCPVGKYTVMNSSLIVGSMDMGWIMLISPSEFTLEYKREYSNGDYKRLIYTYSRTSSLLLN